MNGWNKYYDEPDKRVFYKEEEGNPYGSVITDCVVDAPWDYALACYDNLEVLAILMPEFYDLKFIKKITDIKGCLTGKQSFPWPFYHREMKFHYSGVGDYRNRALISVSTSKKPGEKYFGVEIKDTEEGLVNLEVKMGYNFF